MANPVSLKKIAAAFVVAGMAAGTAQAASVNGTADAKVVTPASITAGTHLNFGTFTNEAAGTVTVDTAGLRTTSGVVLVNDANTPAAGTFSVTSEAGYTVNVTLPADGTVTLAGSLGGSMAVNTFTSSPTASFVSKGTDALTVGATISVSLGQTTGTYTGTYPVTVNY